MSAKNRNYKRVECYENADGHSGVMRLKYKAWLDKSSEMKRRYLQGEVSGDELRKSIAELD